jgi:uncharacterized protein YbjQ (UPF0145 family)
MIFCERIFFVLFKNHYMASLKSIFGGELEGYTELLQASRLEVVDRMMAQAEAWKTPMKANLISGKV